MTRGGPPRRPPGVDVPRLAAYEVLRGVSADDAYANLLLSDRLAAHRLSGRDAAFATELASGALRLRDTYDLVLAECARRPVERIDAPVLDALRLGAHQALSMRVPPHAAVGTTVDLVRRQVGNGPAGFVNAVLRKVAGRPWADWVDALSPGKDADPVGFAAVTHSHPRWVVEALAEALGERSGEIEDLLAADNVPPGVTLVARPGLVERDVLLAELEGAEPTRWSPYGLATSGGNPGDLAAVRRGAVGVQDEGSQLVALAAAEVALEGRDELWLDLCAGPGGKAALWAAVAAQRGARVLASERAPHRADLVRRALAPSAARVLGVVAADGLRPPWRPGTFDRVLVDAPCTGLGALRRRPEARLRRRPSDLDALVPLQVGLLRSGLESVRRGGVVAYATCSPVLAETGGVVEAVLRDLPGTALLDASAELTVPDAGGPLPGTVQLWPHRHGTDAMFLALLRRG